MDNPAPPKLRTDLTYTVHQHKGKLWYAVQDPVNGKFLRLGHREYLLAQSLDGSRSLPEVASVLANIAPEYSATEQEVSQLVAWLQKATLLEYAGAAPPAKATHNKISLNLLYTRVPLFKGYQLERAAAWIAPWVSAPLLVSMFAICVAAALGVLLNWDDFSSATSNLFVEDGRLWWLVAWLVLKSAHELGHAVAAVKVGSQIRAAGISFIFLAPVPYVDISDLWTISNRWHRIWCSAGGILVELSLAAIAAIVALNTSNESLQYFCCAVATMGTVTTLAFNANPLVRFDGYFIASDLLNRPSLWTEGQLAVKNLSAKLLRPTKPIAGRISLVYVLYGLACYQYRIAMLLTLAVWSILVWQGIGIAMVVWGAYATILNPWLKRRSAAKQQAALQAPNQAPLASWNAEAIWGWGVAGTLAIAMWILPSPLQPSAPGVVVLREPATLRAETEGFLTEVFVSAGQSVEAGQLLALLENGELQLQVAQKQNEVTQMRESIHASRSRNELAEWQASEAQLKSLESQLEQLKRKLEKLKVRAPTSGVLVDSYLCGQLGSFCSAGKPLGMIAQPLEIEIQVSAGQSDAECIRKNLGQKITVICGEGSYVSGVIEAIEPRGSDVLDQPLLAAVYGGPINVVLESSESQKDTLRLPTPRFQVRIRLDSQTSAELTPGQMAWIRIPGHHANLWDVFGRWFEKKWVEIEQSAEQA
jgi:putative peptide zinc metalloprotease protein